MKSKQDVNRARAEAVFKKTQPMERNVPKAVQEYQAERERVLERTRKLREERVAREKAHRVTG